MSSCSINNTFKRWDSSNEMLYKLFLTYNFYSLMVSMKNVRDSIFKKIDLEKYFRTFFLSLRLNFSSSSYLSHVYIYHPYVNFLFELLLHTNVNANSCPFLQLVDRYRILQDIPPNSRKFWEYFLSQRNDSFLFSSDMTTSTIDHESHPNLHREISPHKQNDK